jgi:hypothetical protein
MNTPRYHTIGLMVAALFLACSTSTDVAGNSSEVNGVVLGTLVQSDGTTPAAHVNVAMRLRNSLPDIPSLANTLADSATATSDSLGQFRFDTAMVDPGIYVIEAADSVLGIGMIDSVVLSADRRTEVEDTLKAPGAIRGIIVLPEGGDPRKVFVGIFGLGRIVRTEIDGSFLVTHLGEGAYTLQLGSVLDMYGVVDTSGIVVKSGDTTVLDTITLPFTGIPSPKNLIAGLDIPGQSVVLSWAAGSGVDGYRVYRNHADSGYIKIGPNLVKDTFYVDTGAQPSTLYKYQVKAVDAKNSESAAGAAVTVKTDSLLLWQRTVIYAPPYFGATGLQDISVFDLDNDQDQDLIATTPNDGNGPTILWLENNQGAFVQHTIADSLPGFLHAYAPTGTYLNQDGSRDLIAVLEDSKSCWLYWFKNDGAQHFTPIKIDSLPGFCSAITIALMESLTRHAIVPTITGLKGCVWYEYEDDTTFTRHFVPTKISSNATLVADFDRDGDFDFYIQNFEEAQAYWYENSLDSTYIEHLIDNATPESDGAQTIDFDNDKDIDIIARSATGLYLYRNNGAGAFSESALVHADNLGSACFAVDLLGTGKPDLVVSHTDHDGNAIVGWYQNTAQGFALQPLSRGVTENLLAVADLNGDGKPDIIARSAGSDALCAYYRH